MNQFADAVNAANTETIPDLKPTQLEQQDSNLNPDCIDSVLGDIAKDFQPTTNILPIPPPLVTPRKSNSLNMNPNPVRRVDTLDILADVVDNKAGDDPEPSSNALLPGSAKRARVV